MRRLVAVATVTALVAAGAAACSNGDDEPVATTAPPEPTTTTTEPPPPPVAPLTGLPDGAELALARPALSVKIENAPESRPQAGLELADVVYEEVVEGGITRFVVIFKLAGPGHGRSRPVRA